MPGPALVVLRLAGQGLAKGLGSKAGELALGGLLSAVGLDGGEDLSQAQLDTLNSIDSKLDRIEAELEEVNGNLREIERTLKELLTKEIFENWQRRQAPVDEAIAHIAADFQNYKLFTTPSDGKLPKVSEASLKALVDRILLSDGLSDDAALHRIHLAITDPAGRNGALRLFADMLIDELNLRAKTQQFITSRELSRLLDQLLVYYASLVIPQFRAIVLVIEAHKYVGNGLGVLKGELAAYRRMLQAQESSLFEALFAILAAWRNLNFAARPSFLFPFDLQDGAVDPNEKLHWAGFRELPRSLDNTQTRPFAQFLEQELPGVLNGEEAKYLRDTEEMLADLYLIEPTSRRVVVHALDFMVGSVEAASKVAEVVRGVRLHDNAAVEPHVTELVSPSPIGPGGSALLRLVFDLGQDGSYRMEDRNALAPELPGYSPTGAYRFQSRLDLALTAHVDEDSPFDVIRFVPYVGLA